MRPLTQTGNYISTRIGRAIQDYKLIEDKDRILVGVSGGKDSLTLLRLLADRRAWAPIKYDLVAIHVESDYARALSSNPVSRRPSRTPSRGDDKSIKKSLKKFCKDNNIEYVLENISIEDQKRDVNCFWCSWNRRKALFLAADKLGCNKVALGHHKDDIIETLLLNLFYQGEFSAMNPRQELFGGKIVIIRPLCYVEEKYTRKFAKETRLPFAACNCPNADLSKRRMVKKLIAGLEKDCPYIKTNLFKSMGRISREYLQIHDRE